MSGIFIKILVKVLQENEKITFPFKHFQPNYQKGYTKNKSRNIWKGEKYCPIMYLLL